MIGKVFEQIKIGLSLFFFVGGLALFLTMPVAIMLLAAHLADSVSEFGGVVFLSMSLLGLFLTIMAGNFVAKAID